MAENEKRPTLKEDARMFVIMGIAALVLLVFLLSENAGLAENNKKAARFEKNLKEMKDTIRDNHELFFPAKERVTNKTLLRDKSLRTVVKDVAESVQIGGNLVAVNPGADRKKGTVKAKLSLRGVPVRKIVEFIVGLKNLGAGVQDSSATMRMVGYNVDNWRLDLGLEAPDPLAQTQKVEKK